MDFSNKNTAIVIVDMMNTFDFPGGDKLLENTRKIVPNLLKLKKTARENDIPVIYVNDHYGIWQSDFKKVADFCRNEKNKDIIDQMLPTEEDYFLIKPKHSGFYQTALSSLLNELGTEQVVVTGVAGNICVLFTANEAYMREYAIIVPENCMASNEEEENKRALHVMKVNLKADIENI